MLSNLGTWRFMNKMPTIYSELHMEIPGNYNYNRTLRGTRKLDVNNEGNLVLFCLDLKLRVTVKCLPMP